MPAYGHLITDDLDFDGYLRLEARLFALIFWFMRLLSLEHASRLAGFAFCLVGPWGDKAAKAKANLAKHGVSFAEASTAFHDEAAALFLDPDHSHDEDRFILLGMSTRLRIIVVCHCFRQSETVVRIISARRANRSEEADYWRRKR